MIRKLFLKENKEHFTITTTGVAGDSTTIPGVSGNTTTISGVAGNTTTIPGVAGNSTTIPGVEEVQLDLVVDGDDDDIVLLKEISNFDTPAVSKKSVRRASISTSNISLIT